MSQTTKYVDLSKRESSYILMDLESISVTSDFTGKPPSEFLLQRTHEIVRLNPWVAGRLVKENGKVSVKYSDFDENDNNIAADIFKIVKESELIKNGSNLVGHKYLAEQEVKKGSQVLNKDFPLFQIILLEKNENEFILFVSMCHVFGDGHSFYNLYKMLSTDVTPKALTFERNNELINEMVKRTKPHEEFVFSAGFISNLVISRIFSNNGKPKNYKINHEWIKEQKDLYKKNKETNTILPEFISTNDLITSEYFKAAECNIGLMAINLRDKIKELTETYVGNYECAATYTKNTTKNFRPDSIRSGLDQFYGIKPPDDEILPGFFKRYNAKVSWITNWSSFYHELSFDGCKLTLHQPVFSENQSFPCSFGIIYVRKEGELAIIVSEAKIPIVEKMKVIGILGEECETV